MKALIKLTTTANTPYWVNPLYIATMAPYHTGSVLYIDHDKKPTIVRESPETIEQKIEEL
jgi:uncharacterized protein YlzI (FlbEa/FlbD family)